MLTLTGWITVKADYLLLSHSHEQERGRAVTPKVGALFQHFNASVTKNNLTLHRYPLPKHQ